MKKKILMFLLFTFGVFCFCFINVSAGNEIGDYGVNTTYQLDYFDYKEIRGTTYTITDNGRFTNFYDGINITELYDDSYDLIYLRNAGYRTLVVELSFDAWKVDDGYQYVFVYDNPSDGYLGGCKFELNTYSEANCENYCIYMELDIDTITNSKIYIRYGASGAFSDTWKNKNVLVQIGASKELRKTTNFWRLKWDDDTHTSHTCTRLELAS